MSVAAHATPTDQQGFAPDSVYAEWDREHREASDRMEVHANMRQGAVLARRDAHEGHTVQEMPDDGLRRMAKRLRRDLEDIAEGDAPKSRQRITKARLNDVECEQAYRAALAETWLASEGGTHCYTSFHARGGLDAVRDHGATPPSYWLAARLDWREFKHGLPSVFDWEPEETGR